MQTNWDLLKIISNWIEGVSSDSPALQSAGYDNLLQGVVTVAAAGTSEQLASDQAARKAEITALGSNTGNVYVGNSSVSSAAYGKALAAGESVTLSVSNLNLIYLDVDTGGEGVSYLSVN